MTYGLASDLGNPLCEYPDEPFRICDSTDEQQRIDVLQDIAAKCSTTPEVQRLAHLVRSEAGRNAGQERLAREALLAIQCLEYHPHPSGEWFQSVRWTLNFGGNCEDLSTALVSLLLALGIPARVAWITQDDMPLNHVVARLENGLWADPSVWGARLGETPYDAIDRVRMEGVTRPADLVFRASREYPMFKRNVKMKAPVSRTQSAGLPFPSPPWRGSVLVITAPAQNASSATPPSAISGTAPLNAQVKITRFGTGEVLGQVTAVDGTWTLSLPIYPPGTYALVASIVPGGATASVKFTVLAPGSTATVPLSIASPANNSTLSTPPSAVSGRASPGASVIVTHGTDSVGTVAADASGNWSIALPVYPPGAHSINARTSAENVTVQFTIAGAAALAITSPAAGSTVAASPTSISGTAPPNTAVTVLDGGETVGVVTSDATGAWRLALSVVYPQGSHTLVAKAGGLSASVTFSVSGGSVAAPTPAPAQSSNTIWWILGAVALGAVLLSGSKKEPPHERQ